MEPSQHIPATATTNTIIRDLDTGRVITLEEFLQQQERGPASSNQASTGHPPNDGGTRKASKPSWLKEARSKAASIAQAARETMDEMRDNINTKVEARIQEKQGRSQHGPAAPAPSLDPAQRQGVQHHLPEDHPASTSTAHYAGGALLPSGPLAAGVHDTKRPSVWGKSSRQQEPQQQGPGVVQPEAAGHHAQAPPSLASTSQASQGADGMPGVTQPDSICQQYKLGPNSGAAVLQAKALGKAMGKGLRNAFKPLTTGATGLGKASRHSDAGSAGAGAGGDEAEQGAEDPHLRRDSSSSLGGGWGAAGGVTGADSAADRFSLQAGSTAATAATTRAAGKSKLSSWGAKGAKAWSQLKGGLSKVSGAAGREHEAGGSGEEEEGEEEDASTRGRLSAGVEEEEEYGEGEEEEDDEEAALLPKARALSVLGRPVRTSSTRGPAGRLLCSSRDTPTPAAAAAAAGQQRSGAGGGVALGAAGDERPHQAPGVRLIQSLPAHEGPIWVARLSREARLLATGGHDGLVKVWRLPYAGQGLGAGSSGGAGAAGQPSASAGGPTSVWGKARGVSGAGSSAGDTGTAQQQQQQQRPSVWGKPGGSTITTTSNSGTVHGGSTGGSQLGGWAGGEGSAPPPSHYSAAHTSTTAWGQAGGALTSTTGGWGPAGGGGDGLEQEQCWGGGAAVSPAPVAVLAGHRDVVLDLSWSAGGFLLTASADGTAQLWHMDVTSQLGVPLAGGEQGSAGHKPGGAPGSESASGFLQVVALQVCDHPDIVTCVAFHPHSARTFATGCADGRVRVWSAAEGTVVASASIQGDMVTALAWSQDGGSLIAGTLHGRCRHYSWVGSPAAGTLPGAVALQADAGAGVAAGGAGGNGSHLSYIATIDVRDRRAATGRPGARITSLTPIPGRPGAFIVTSNDSRIRQYMRYTLEVKYKGLRNRSTLVRASLTSDGSFIACGSDNGWVYLWEVQRVAGGAVADAATDQAGGLGAEKKVESSSGTKNGRYDAFLSDESCVTSVIVPPPLCWRVSPEEARQRLQQMASSDPSSHLQYPPAAPAPAFGPRAAAAQAGAGAKAPWQPPALGSPLLGGLVLVAGVSGRLLVYENL